LADNKANIIAYKLHVCLLVSQGDSGGPLATEREDKKFELIGK
jgi:hypothetical protein